MLVVSTLFKAAIRGCGRTIVDGFVCSALSLAIFIVASQEARFSLSESTMSTLLGVFIGK